MIEIRNESASTSQHKIIPEENHHNELGNGELVNNIDTDSDASEETDWSTRNDTKNEKLTEDHLVTAAVNYSHGTLPLVNRVLSLTDPDLNALDHIPVLQRSVLHPLLAVKILYYKLIHLLGSRTFSKYLPFNRTDIQLFLLLIYSLFSTESITLFIPMVLFSGSFVAMIITTFQMLQASRDFQDFRVWSGLFLTYSGGSLNAEQAEFQFIRNNLKPYGHFFIALLTNLIVYPLIAEQWIPQSEITVIAFCLTFMTLLTFMIKERSRRFPDFLLLFSFAVNVLAKYPYETDPVVTQGWRFLDLKIPTFASYIIGNGIEFCLNFRLMFYIVIPIIFVYIAARQRWRGTYKFLIPHCVTLSWLQIVIINSQGATMFGLLRGTLALVGIVLFLPLVGLTTVLLPAAAVAKWLVVNNFVFSFAVFVVIASAGLGISWLLSQTRYSKYVGLLQIILGLAAAYVLLHSAWENKTMNLYTKLEPRRISWEQYQNICHQPAWDQSNIAKTQLKCHVLANAPVSWNGYVNEIKLKSVQNTWKYFIDKLPYFVSNYLYCYYGETIEDECHNVSDLFKDDCMLLNDIVKANRKCSLDYLNVYEYELSVRMQSGIWGKSAEVMVIVEHVFSNFTLQLKANDKIWFNGDLVNNMATGSDGWLGGMKPYVVLKEIGCLACHNMNLTSFKAYPKVETDYKKVFSLLYGGVKFVLNILFNPIVVFK